jgi:ribonucleotide reductase beta subunit family protein with ferritin-like domain
LLDKRVEFRPFEYNEAYEFVKKQNNHHWTHSQIDVDSDLTQYHTEFTEAEKHGINTVLKLFTRYEMRVGNYWTDVIYHRFPKPEIQMMAQVMGSMEVEHALFYDKLNQALGLDSREFHLSFLEDPNMKKRDKFIGKMLSKGLNGTKKDLATSIAAFTFVEGVILYSSFAFLLSFQQQSKGKLKNVAGTGLAYSVRDEALHAEAGSWLFNTFVDEYNIDRKSLETNILDIARSSYELEKNIIDNIFSKGSIEGITDRQLKNFVKSRINKKLKDIGIDQFEKISYNPIGKWFYKSINAVEFSDFFNQNPTSYSNHWNFGKIQKW